MSRTAAAPASASLTAVVAALSCAVALLAGCARTPDASEALVDTARGAADAATVTATAGEIRRAAGADVRLPDDFPPDILLPERYAVVSVTTMGPSRSVVLRSDEAMTPLYERFRAAQSERGWEETVSMLGAEGAMLGFRKGARGVVANFRPDMEGRTLVSLSLQPQVVAAPR